MRNGTRKQTALLAKIQLALEDIKDSPIPWDLAPQRRAAHVVSHVLIDLCAPSTEPRASNLLDVQPPLVVEGHFHPVLGVHRDLPHRAALGRSGAAPGADGDERVNHVARDLAGSWIDDAEYVNLHEEGSSVTWLHIPHDGLYRLPSAYSFLPEHFYVTFTADASIGRPSATLFLRRALLSYDNCAYIGRLKFVLSAHSHRQGCGANRSCQEPRSTESNPSDTVDCGGRSLSGQEKSSDGATPTVPGPLAGGVRTSSVDLGRSTRLPPARCCPERIALAFWSHQDA